LTTRKTSRLLAFFAGNAYEIGTLLLPGLAFFLFIPALALPAFGSDGRWIALALNTPLDPFNLDWSVPPLFAILLRLFGDGAIEVLRGLALALHLAIGSLLARWVLRRTHQRGASLATLAIALFSPFAYRSLTSLTFLPNLIAIILLVLAAICQQQRRRELALALLILGILLIGLHTAPAQALFALFTSYSGVVLFAWLIGLALAKFVSSIVPVALRTLSALLIAAIALGGAAINRDWFNTYTQASSAQRVALTLTRDPMPQHNLLMLNVPWAVGASATSAFLLGDDQQLWPADTVAQQALVHNSTPVTLTFGSIKDNSVEIPSAISGHTAYYSSATIWSWKDLQPLLSKFDAIVVGREIQGQYQARVIGALGESDPPTNYLARFEKGDSVILLTNMEQCAPNGLSISLWVQHAGPSQATANLFRHALRNEAKVAGNDNGFLGGWLSIAALSDGAWVRDVAYFDDLNIRGIPDAMRIGLYDWQTGDRWLALHPDGAQWAENAVTLPRPSSLLSCALASGK